MSVCCCLAFTLVGGSIRPALPTFLAAVGAKRVSRSRNLESYGAPPMQVGQGIRARLASGEGGLLLRLAGSRKELRRCAGRQSRRRLAIADRHELAVLDADDRHFLVRRAGLVC